MWKVAIVWNREAVELMESIIFKKGVRGEVPFWFIEVKSMQFE